MYKAAAVIWCALRVRVTCEARRNESAVPVLAISACASACVHPLPCSQSPSVLSANISTWRPPNITTSLSSPCVSGHFHCICFARANNGWSKARTGVWPGLRWSMAFRTTSIECLIIATVCALSWNRGSSEDGVMIAWPGSWLLAWYAAHDIFWKTPSVAIFCTARTFFRFSSHSYSFFLCSAKLSRLREATVVAGNVEPLTVVTTEGTSV